MAKPSIRFTYERHWLSAPLAFWVHVPDKARAGQWSPPAPAAVLHKGYPVLLVTADQHELAFSSPEQLAHCIEVLAAKPMPTSQQLALKRGAPIGPNGHWLSRLPAKLKSPRRREQLVLQLRVAYMGAVRNDGNGFITDDRSDAETQRAVTSTQS